MNCSSGQTALEEMNGDTENSVLVCSCELYVPRGREGVYGVELTGIVKIYRNPSLTLYRAWR